MSHNEIAKGLKISRSYFSRIAREGCPTSSIKAARDWIAARTAAIGKAPAPATLNDARLKKLLLECSILQIRLERESSNTSFLPVETMQAGATMFLRWCLIALKQNADAMAEGLAAANTPQEARKLLGELISLGWATSAVSWMAQTDLDPRMVNAIKAAIQTEVAGVSDETIAGWISQVAS